MGGKAYRHDRDAQTLRDTLRAVKAAMGIGTQTLLNQCNLAARIPKGEQRIERAQLDKFIKGEASNRAVALGALYDFLRTHTVYREYFPADAPAVADFPSALAAFFTPAGRVTNRYPMEAVRSSLPGEYVMIRRDLDPATEPDNVRSSLVVIKETGNAVTIEERQDFQQPLDANGYRQRDSGYLFPYADYVYFLMKEAGDPATAVKWGLIDFAMPDIGEEQNLHTYFSGYLFTSSRRGIFPLARFACRRYSPELHPKKSGIVKLSDIRDVRARTYIRADYD